jgi:hypothetical protein
MFVDQANDRIIWLTTNIYNKLPLLQPGINYRNYYGEISQDDWINYKNFNLFYDVKNKSLKYFDLPFVSDEEKTFIEVSRYRCQAFAHLNNIFNFHVERYNLPNNSYLESICEHAKEDWIGAYQKIFDITMDNASKLLDFKIIEHNRSIFKLESTRLETMTKLKNATTKLEIKSILDITNIKLMNVEDSVL